ncbi:MAG: ABC transporter permease [Chloroflexi bacterium]|nr:ABC transporter permease [Chloroflexota bacterium]
MAQLAQHDLKRQAQLDTLKRIGKYTIIRFFILFFAVAVGIYLTILVANMGGYVDEIQRAEIRENIAIQISMNPEYKKLSTEERKQLQEKLVVLEEERLGLNQPFIIRSFNYLKDALTLNLGRAKNMTSDSGSRQVKLIILERLPATVLLFGTSFLINFIASLFLALMLSRRYGSFWDRFVVALSPTSAAPGWFYGIFLIVIFAAWLRVLPYGGMVDAPPPEDPLKYALSVAEHMVLPLLALAISSIFLSIYSWRTFFLIYSSEDYVEMAKAKGLTDRTIERRYILRPTLPTIVTNFALSAIAVWLGAIIFETVFNWPGIGRVYFQAIGLFDTAVIVGTTVLYAYLLAITVFLLDIVYAFIDPRVKIG